MFLKNIFELILSKRYYPGIIKRIRIRKPVLISKNINFKDRIFIRDGCRLELVEIDNNKPNLLIMDNVNIEQHCHITCGEEVVIGKNTAVLANVCITDIDHPYEDIKLSPKYTKYKTTPVYIGEDCLIGINSVILGGTTLGKHVIVGANSVIRGEFPDYCVLAGSPAKIIKKYNSNTGNWEKCNI